MVSNTRDRSRGSDHQVRQDCEHAKDGSETVFISDFLSLLQEVAGGKTASTEHSSQRYRVRRGWERSLEAMIDPESREIARYAGVER